MAILRKLFLLPLRQAKRLSLFMAGDTADRLGDAGCVDAAGTPLVRDAIAAPSGVLVRLAAGRGPDELRFALATVAGVGVTTGNGSQIDVRQAVAALTRSSLALLVVCLLAPAVLASGPISLGSATLAAFAPGAATAVPQTITSGLSKLGFYGKTEATPAMREEARRRALAQAGTQRYAAADKNIGSMLAEDVMGSEPFEPFTELGKGLGSAARTVENVLEKGKRPGTVAQAGKLFLGEKKTPEEFALGKGGEFAENARRVKAAPEKFVPVGPRDTETDRLTGMEYAQIVSPKIAAVEYRNEFDAWAKRFPKEAQVVLTEVAKEGAARQATAKAAAPLLKVADYIEQNAGALPVGEDVGMSDEDLSITLGMLGVSQAENSEGRVSEERAADLIARLRTPR